MTRLSGVTFIILAALLSCAVFALADMYTWKDENGNLHITQTPPPEGADIIKTIVYPTATPLPPGYATTTPIISSQETPVPAAENASSPTPTVYATATPFKDRDGHDKEWWQQKKASLSTRLEELKNSHQANSDSLRILNQGHRRPDEVDDLRNKQDALQADIDALEKELENLDEAVRAAGGFPGWVR